MLNNLLGAHNRGVGCSIKGGAYLGEEHMALEGGNLTLRARDHVMYTLEVGHFT